MSGAARTPSLQTSTVKQPWYRVQLVACTLRCNSSIIWLCIDCLMKNIVEAEGRVGSSRRECARLRQSAFVAAQTDRWTETSGGHLWICTNWDYHLLLHLRVHKPRNSSIVDPIVYFPGGSVSAARCRARCSTHQARSARRATSTLPRWRTAVAARWRRTAMRWTC